MVYSSNIGSVKIGQIVGQKRLKQFLENIGILGKLDFDIKEIEDLCLLNGESVLKTVSYGHGITTTPIQLAKGYAILANGGYDIQPTLIKKEFENIKNKKRILNEDLSSKLNPILRKVVKYGTASLSDVEGYEIGGKTGTAQIVENGVYTKKKKLIPLRLFFHLQIQSMF